MVEGHADFRPLSAAGGNDGPVGAEPEGEFAGEGQHFLLQEPGPGEIEDDEQQQGFVRGGIAAGPVHLERGDLFKPVCGYVHTRLPDIVAGGWGKSRNFESGIHLRWALPPPPKAAADRTADRSGNEQEW